MPETRARWLWYERPGFVVAALIIFWPLGLSLAWTQKKFTRETRVALSASLPIATVLVAMVALAVLGGPSADQRSQAGAMGATSPASAIAEALASRPSANSAATAAAGATTSASTTSAPPDAAADAAPVSPPESAARRPPAPAPEPASEPAQPNAPQSRFSLSGSYTPMGVVDFTMKAGQTKGIAKYEWWVTAIDVTTRYTGQSVTDSYVGHPPQSVLLVTTDTAGNKHTSRAPVAIAGEVMFAEAN